jgi:hypothetical protein
MAEAIAMKEGLALASRLGCNSVVAESHSIKIIQSYNGKKMWWSTSALIFADYVDLVSSIGTVLFKHCWNLHENGKFLVESMYNVLIQPDVHTDKFLIICFGN